LEIHELDFVDEALRRARRRLASQSGRSKLGLNLVQCNLDLRAGFRGVPLRSGTFDAVLASLLLSYVDAPESLLAEMWRLLRPRGRIVVSTLRKDADISKIHLEILEELRVGLTQGSFEEEERPKLEPALQSLLNDAARLLDFEEQGAFRFWEAADLCDLVQRAGFTDVRTRLAFGDPPQAIVLSASRL
jgi:ubiquinone/menaquinone biosynthesis C-methylase UbiE